MDRLSSALVCRPFAKVVGTPDLMMDIRLNVAKTRFAAPLTAAAAVLSKTERQYTSLLVYKGIDRAKTAREVFMQVYLVLSSSFVPLALLHDYDSFFWDAVKGSLRELELIRCKWSPRSLYQIIRNCSKLESLRIGKPQAKPDLASSPVL